MVAVIWAYDGVSSITAIAGEVRDPQRTLPISLTASIGIIAAVYVLVNLIYFMVLGFNGVARSGAVAAAALKAGIGPAGAVVIAVMVMASALGTVAAQMVGNPRFFVGTRRERPIPSATCSHIAPDIDAGQRHPDDSGHRDGPGDPWLLWCVNPVVCPELLPLCGRRPAGEPYDCASDRGSPKVFRCRGIRCPCCSTESASWESARRVRWMIQWAQFWPAHSDFRPTPLCIPTDEQIARSLA